jgi:hypothetical protein
MHDEGGKPIYEDPLTLRHANKATEKNRDVTCVEWSRDGQFAATGSLDGVARSVRGLEEGSAVGLVRCSLPHYVVARAGQS